MRMRLGMSSCIVMLLLHLCLTLGVGFKAVMDVLDAMIRDGMSLARSVELTAQWDEILWVGPVHLLGWGDFELAWSGGLGECRRVGYFGLGLFIP